MTAPRSRDIPGPIRRALRQEAGFGCCKCGHPFLEYHHIVPFAEALAHNPVDMMVLCPIHHHMATVGALALEDQRVSKNQPFNIQNGFANGQLVISQRAPAIELGSVQFAGNGPILVVNQETILSVASDPAGRLQLSCDLYDETDQLLLSVQDNEWISGDPLPWDMEFGYNKLVLRLEPRRIALSLDARGVPATVGGSFWRRGQQFSVSKSQVTVNGAIQDVTFAHLAFAGASLTIDIEGKKVGIVPHPDVEQAGLISWPDPMERMERALKAYATLPRRHPPRPHW